MEKKTIKLGLGSFDLAKGTAILLVVLSHTPGHYDWSQSSAQQIISTISYVLGTGFLTAFFIISGMGLKIKNPKSMLKKSFTDLIVPYLWIAAAYAVVYPLVRFPMSGSWSVVLDQAARFVAAFLLGYAKYGKLIFGVQIFWCTAAWFLLATFVAFNILNLILHLKRQSLQVLCVIACAVVGNLLFSMELFYFCIPQGLRAVGYLYIGYRMKRHCLLERLLKKVWVYLILIPFCLVQMKFGTLDNTVFVNVVLEYVGSAFSAIFFIFVFVYLGTFEFKGFGLVKLAGIYSYWILCLHSAEMDIIPWYLNAQLFSGHPWWGLGMELFIKVWIYILGCMLLKRISKRKYRRRQALNGK